MVFQELANHLARLTAARLTDREWRIPRFSTLYIADGPRLKGVPAIKITGTNGKGSVAAMLEACLTAAGWRVGLSTSPHLERITERIRIDGEEISAADFSQHLAELEAFLAGLLQEKGERYIPSFFEALLLITLRAFEQARVDFALFEAGVGGAHDPTSVIPGFLSVLTTVAFDHEAELGGTLAEIAAEKAGIADGESLLILGPALTGEARAAVDRTAAGRGVRVLQARRDRVRSRVRSLSGTRAVIALHGRDLEVELPLLGDSQLDNLATVLAVADAIVDAGFAIGPAGWDGLARVHWPARLEYRPGDPSWLLDGAHNEEAMAALAAFVQESFPKHERLLIYGTTSRKTYRRYLHLLPEIASEVLLTDDFDDAEDRVVLARELEGKVRLGEASCKLGEILTELRRRPGGERRLVVIAGSLYLVGKARGWLNAGVSARGLRS